MLKLEIQGGGVEGSSNKIIIIITVNSYILVFASK
jgi:hypothetical protein